MIPIAESKAGKELEAAYLEWYEAMQKTKKIALALKMYGLQFTITEFYNKCHNPETGQFDDCDAVAVGDRLASSKPAGSNEETRSYRAGLGPRMSMDLIPDDSVKKIIDRQSKVPGFEDLKGRTDRAALDVIRDRQADIMTDYADQVMSINPKTAAASADWYPWANKYMRGLAEAHGINENGAIAATAALSSSAPWESNLPWAKYIVENMSTKAGPEGGINQKVSDKWVVARFIAETSAGHNPDAQAYASMIGKRLHELNDDELAIAIRGKHDSAGTFNQKTGKFSVGEVRQLGEEVHAGLGTKGYGTIPQSQVNIKKAISAIRNPTKENIDNQIGAQNKVRSFYQNIRDPLDTRFDDVTADTHHFGIANGHAWTISSRFIKSGENNIVSTPGNKTTGALGSYPIVVEATRIATARINAKYGTNYTPNQMQSILWEHHKNNFPPDIRSNKEMITSIENARTQHALYLKTGGREGLSLTEMKATIDAARIKAGGPTIQQLIERYTRG